MNPMFKDEHAYTAKTLAQYHGMDERHWNYILKQVPNFTISRDPNSKKPRLAAFGRDLNRWYEDQQRKQREAERKAEEASQPKTRGKRRPRMESTLGLNPDGTIMNSKQLKAAGLWKGA